MSTDTDPRPLTALEVAREATSPTQLVALAIANGTPAETLARLLDVQERWQAIQAKKEFDAAMASFKSECPPAIIKASTVDFTSQKGRTHYNYADLGDITEVVTPILSRHGLSASWETDTETPNMVKVTCEIAHKGGHCKKTSLKGQVDASGQKNALQAIGSAVTYLSRYTLQAALGLATKGQDDDGRAAGQAIDQGYREPDSDNGSKKATEKPLTPSGGANSSQNWVAFFKRRLAAIKVAEDIPRAEAALNAIRNGLANREFDSRKLPGFLPEEIAELEQAITDADNALAIGAGQFHGPDSTKMGEQLQLLETLLKMATAPEAVDKIAEQWEVFPDLDDATKAKGVETIKMRRVALGGTT